MPKIIPFLWFNNEAEEAMRFYVSIFQECKDHQHEPLWRGGTWPGGNRHVGTFQLEGQEFMALNGGPQFKFTPAISLFVNCETQPEVDELWEKLSAGGQKERCGWLTDKYGLSWQIIPTTLGKMLADKNPEKSKRVMQAMLQMQKIDIDGLKRASEQK